MSAPTRSGIRKRTAIRFGRKTVRLSIGQAREHFAVHEELLCKTPYFRTLLQPNRKPIEGTCSICHDELLPETEELVHCSASCGGNFHQGCIKDWKSQTPARGTTKCPLCRHKWVESQTAIVRYLPELDPGAFDVYVEWLYSATVVPPVSENDLLNCFEAYALGARVENQEFCSAALGAIVDHCHSSNRLPTAAEITYAFNIASGARGLQRFLAGLFVHAYGEFISEILDVWDELPGAFTRDLMKSVLDGVALKPTVAWTAQALKDALCSQPCVEEDSEEEMSSDSEQTEEEGTVQESEDEHSEEIYGGVYATQSSSESGSESGGSESGGSSS